MNISFSSLSQGVSQDPAADGNCDGFMSNQPPYVPFDTSSPPFVPDVECITSPQPHAPAHDLIIPTTPPEYIIDDDFLLSIPLPTYIPDHDWLRSSSPRVPVDNYGDWISDQPPSVPVDDWMPPPPTTDAYYGGDYWIPMPPPPTTDAYYGGDYWIPPLEGDSSYDPALSLVPVDGCGDFQMPPLPAAAHFGGGGDQPPQPLEGVPYPMQSIEAPSLISPVESGGGDGEDWKWSLPPGMRFRPMDEELLVHYLKPKFLNRHSDSREIIKFADIYDYEPHQLQGLAYDHGDGKMYFYTRIKKIGKMKTERIIKSKKGYWKGTQTQKPIWGESGNILGTKTPLVYFIYNDKKKEKEKEKEKKKKKSRDIKTSWHMSEYRLKYPHDAVPSSQELVLAVVYYYCHAKRNH